MADNKTIKTQVGLFDHRPRHDHIEASIRAIWNRKAFTVKDIDYPEGPKPCPEGGFPWSIVNTIERLTRS